ncbi:substrate-binding domain-containing protein [Micromonospora sp. NPDC005299]|uniref:substrate-binding domain-containing protein n=1 Tax=Micromonospora sp. NPDC005299 TaxID=3364231 RepID=UPI003696A2C0
MLGAVPQSIHDVDTGTTVCINWRHLLGLGHRRIALLGGPRGSWTNREIRRAAGTAARTGRAELTVLGPNQPTEIGGGAVADQVRRNGVTAVLAYNDLMAIGLIEGLDALGLRVPQDVSVVGVDDIALDRLTRPKLTTVATPTAAAGVGSALSDPRQLPRLAALAAGQG